MVSTRSKTAKQTHLEDFAPTNKTSPTSRSKPQKKQSTAASRKRKASESGTQKNAKKPKTTASPSKNEITINRAPVLTLWSATVTHFLYPSLSWSTCLSAGSAISAICAISKGRSIGMISEPDEEQKEERKKKKESDVGFEELEVMHFKLKMKDGIAFVGRKKQSGSEGALKGKFGDAYENVRGVFEEGLEKWREGKREKDLDEKAFRMYEKFRPEVPVGQRGWGRKGVLDLEKVGRVIGEVL